MNRIELINFIFKNIDTESSNEQTLKLMINSLHEYDLLLCYQWISEQIKIKKPSKTLFYAFTNKNCKDKNYRVNQMKYQEIDLYSLNKKIFRNRKHCASCEKVLIKKTKESKHDFDKRKYCDILCANKFANGKHRLQKLQIIGEKKCEFCNIILKCRKKERPNKFSTRRFCSRNCRAKAIPINPKVLLKKLSNNISF